MLPTYTCSHTHIYIYPHIYTHIHGPMHTHIHTDTQLHVSPTHTYTWGHAHTWLYIHTRTPAHPPHIHRHAPADTCMFTHMDVHTDTDTYGHRHTCMCAHMCIASVVGAGCGATLGLCPGRGDYTSEAGNSLLPQNSARPPSSTTGDGLGGSGLCSPPGRMEGWE